MPAKEIPKQYSLDKESFKIIKVLLRTNSSSFYMYKNNTAVNQRAKKVVSDSPGLVDFAIRLVIFVLNLPDGQVLFFWGNPNYRRIVINPANQKGF